MGLKIGVCGAGLFASSFLPLFQAHPLVEEVCLAEVFPERRAEQAARFGVKRTFASLDELCASDVDAIALFTQRWLHGPQAVSACHRPASWRSARTSHRNLGASRKCAA